MDALKQAQKDGVVVGLKAVAGIAQRLDVDKFLLELPNTFNLFCLALSELMNDSESSDLMGYFKIAGIHGLPKVLWDGIDAPNKEAGNLASSGYCVHSSLNFPTWHRPYLSMVEQTIFTKMLDIAEQFPGANKQTYRDAAKEFRLPYWDYYRPRGKTATFPGVVDKGTTSFKYDFSVPQIFTVDKIMLKTPTKNQLTLSSNPLHLFNFPETGGIPVNEWKIIGSDSARFSREQTQRYPNSSNPVESLNAAINKNRESGTGLILDMISDPGYDQYSAFATDSATRGPSGSLEGIHGTYHVLIGGSGGHMTRVPVAAFDPIFFIHHCQIDRWFAIWQDVHPDAWFDSDQGNLLPFRSSKRPEHFWTSRSSKSTEDFGYTYPDLVGGARQVKNTFKKNYSWSVRTSGNPTFGSPPTDMTPLDLSHAQVYQYTAGSQAATTIQTLMAAPVNLVQDVAASAKEALPEAADKQDVKRENVRPSADKRSIAMERSFRNMDETQVALTASQSIDESSVSREWWTTLLKALNGAFTIYFFIGETPAEATDTGEFISYPTLGGVSHVFAAPVEACDNCGNQQEQGQRITNTAPITPILLDYVHIGDLEDMSPEKVKPFLVKHLKWRVVEANGAQVGPRTVAGLEIGVSSKLTPLDGEGDVTYQEFPEVISEIIENSS